MQKYQIIPRKFRPKRFDEVAGHPAIVTTLKNALKNERSGQAYLFCGARGCGKTTLARLFAKALNCAHLNEDQEPCNQCTSCQEISEGRSLDIIEIDGASNRGIDDIRQINETVGYAPSTAGQTKIYIIDEVHMLTKEAFNALLKTLEEPPKNVKFFFATTEPHKVPQTIISRCQRFNLSRIPEKDLVQKLQRITQELEVPIEEEALIQISRLSEGSLRDAESLLDQLICFGKTPITLSLTREVFGLISTDHLFDLDEAIHIQSFEKGVQIAKTLYESGKDLGATIDGLLEHFRTYLLIHLGHSPKGSYEKWATNYSKSQCLTILDTLIDWQQQMVKTPFKQIHLEMLLLNLVRSKNPLSMTTLIDRLIQLEQKLNQKKATPSPEPVEAKPQSVPKPQHSEKKPEPEVKVPESKEEYPSKYETLIRFAAVELEGSIEK